MRAGPEVMQRIAAPMIGGMVTAPLLSLLVIPAAWLVMMRSGSRRDARRLAKLGEPQFSAD